MARFIDELKRSHLCGQLRAGDIGKEVVLFGWVQYYRDFGGLRFVGPGETAMELAQLLRPVVEVQGAPNYLSDFVFALEVACQDAGLLDEDFNEVA